MKLYIILLLLILTSCNIFVKEVPIEETKNETIKNVTEINLTQLNKTISQSRYSGFYGVYNFSEFNVEECGNLIKYYNDLLNTEENRIDRKKNNVREVREDFKKALNEFQNVLLTNNETLIDPIQKETVKLNQTVIEKEQELKETKEYFAKIKYSLRLIEEECERLILNSS